MEDKRKMIILILIIIVLLILLVCFIILKRNSNKYEENTVISNVTNQSNETNTINSNQSTTNSVFSLTETEFQNLEDEDIEGDSEDEDEDEEESEDEDEDEDEDKYLSFDVRLSTYFLTKYCLETYYNNTTMEAKESLIDSDSLIYYNENLFDWVDKNNYCSATFAIDEIYMQELSDNMNIILVYYRYTTDNENCNSSVMAIRVDNKNSTFSLYSYEYLQANNYAEFKDGDQMVLENINSIEKNNYNQYDMNEIETTGEACTQELFQKLKFDILVDNDHLYSTLDEEYKEARFPTIQDLENYIEENKEDITYEKLTHYKISITTSYVQLTGKTNKNRYLTFNAPLCLMSYTVYLDNYTIVLSDVYEDSIATWQAPYCLERIFSAINEKDYTFVYEHLNPIQKNNYYKTEEEFVEYMEKIFYENNNFEIDDDYLTVSDEVYQYTVYVTNNEDTSQSKTLTMTVTVEDGTDFVVAIK